MIYYGDEVGMWGADDPTSRKPMLWKDLAPFDDPADTVLDEQLTFYKQAIALRNAHPALRTGDFQTLLTDDEQDVWVFHRFDDQEDLIVALNASEDAATVEVPLADDAPTSWQGVFGTSDAKRARDGRLTLEVPALGGVVVHAATAE
jgi:glycosidase